MRRRLGLEIEDLLEPTRLASLREAGFLILDANGLRATPAGRQRLNAVIDYLLAAKAAAPGAAISS